MSIYDGLIGQIWPEYKAEYERAELTKQRRMQGEKDIAEDERMAKGKQAISLMELGAMSGRPDVYAKGRQNLYSLIPDGGKLSDLEDTPNGPVQMRILPGGAKEPQPITTQSMREEIAEARALLDPATFYDTVAKKREEREAFNQKARGNPKLTRQGDWAWSEVDDNGDYTWFSRDEAGQTRRLRGKPVFYEDLSPAQKFRADEQKIATDKAQEGKYRSGSAVDAAQVRNLDAETAAKKEDLKQKKEGGKKKIYNLGPGGKLVDEEGNEIASNPKEKNVNPLDFQRLEKMIFDAGDEPTETQVNLINDVASELGYDFIEIEPGKVRPFWFDKKAKYGLVKKGDAPQGPSQGDVQTKTLKSGETVRVRWDGKKWVEVLNN